MRILLMHLVPVTAPFLSVDFWMDATEITNNEYRQFVFWVRDSVAARKMGYVKAGADGNEYVDWAEMKTDEME